MTGGRVSPGVERERGAALATVLIMVAVMSGLAMVIVDAARFSLQRTTNQQQMDQTRWYLLGAEAYAAGRIDQLINSQNISAVDFARLVDQPISLPLDAGGMQIAVHDGGNCFNLNGLVTSAENGGFVANDVSRVQFARMMTLLNIPDGLQLASAAADWVDSDGSLATSGREDDAYGGALAAYLPPNRLMGDVGELRFVTGFTSALTAQLSPYLCSRPQAASNVLNVNTLRRDQAVLLAATFGAGLTLSAAEQVIVRRPVSGWRTVEEFLRDPALSGAEASEQTRALFSVIPRWYLVGIRVQYQGATETSVVLIDAGSGHPHVIRRVFGANPDRALL